LWLNKFEVIVILFRRPVANKTRGIALAGKEAEIDATRGWKRTFQECCRVDLRAFPKVVV